MPRKLVKKNPLYDSSQSVQLLDLFILFSLFNRKPHVVASYRRSSLFASGSAGGVVNLFAPLVPCSFQPNVRVRSGCPCGRPTQSSCRVHAWYRGGSRASMESIAKRNLTEMALPISAGHRPDLATQLAPLYPERARCAH